MRLMLLIAVKNRLGLMDVYIGNLLCTTPCAENICSCFNVEFGPRCVASVVLKRDLYGLKMASNSFQKYFGYFIRDLGFTPSRVDQYFWIFKHDKYEKYEYIAAYVDDVIIAAKNLQKYMHDNEMHFKVKYIMDSTKYYLVNELVHVGYCIHVSSKKYVNEILRKYQKTYGYLKK